MCVCVSAYARYPDPRLVLFFLKLVGKVLESPPEREAKGSAASCSYGWLLRSWYVCLLEMTIGYAIIMLGGCGFLWISLNFERWVLEYSVSMTWWTGTPTNPVDNTV